MNVTRTSALGRLEMQDFDPGYWHGTTRVGDHEVTISVQASGDDEAPFDHAASIVERLPPILPAVMREIAELFLFDHQEWTGPTAARTVDELAARLRLEDIVVDANGAPTLWFGGDVFSEHSITAALTRELALAGIERA